VATIIISGSRGTDDPTMATLPFMAAKAAKEQGHDVVVWLWNEAVTLGRKGMADHVAEVNLTPLKDLLAAVQQAIRLIAFPLHLTIRGRCLILLNSLGRFSDFLALHGVFAGLTV
jgi:predicted peroxiredoxin